MIDNLNDYYVVVGGDYGITCEEINEDSVAKFIENIDNEIILTGEVGKSISEKISKEVDWNGLIEVLKKDEGD